MTAERRPPAASAGAALPSRLVIASRNPGKLREFDALLAPLGISLVAMEELAIPEPAEPYPTFLENALAKARHAAAAAGMAALADDSGLCVDALGGAPGVRSARYAGEPASDQRNNQRLLQELAGHAERGAAFVCTLVLLRHPGDPDPLVAQGRWRGQIARAPAGSGGFGYDPLFWLPEAGCTSAELAPAAKNALSHRGQALRRLLELLRPALAGPV